MDQLESQSEVARAMHQIELEQEAADRALHGFAITARHDVINARMQRGGERILQLIEEGRHEEAQELLNSDTWSDEGNLGTRTRRKRRKQKNSKGKR